jgi:hypothetical protein
VIIPTAFSNNGNHYSLLSNKVTDVAYNQAIPSFIDNFFYGYADTIPTAATSSTPTPMPASPQTTVPPTSQPTPTPTIPEIPVIPIIPIALVMLLVVATFKLKRLNGEAKTYS